MRIRFPKISRRIAKLPASFRPGIAYALLLAFGLQTGAPAWAWESPGTTDTSFPAAIPVTPHLDLDGPTVSEFNDAFPNRPGRAVQKVDPIAFRRYVNSHPGQGRLLTGSALAAAVAVSGETPPTAVAGPPRVLSDCDTVPPAVRERCKDSLTHKTLSPHTPKAIREMRERDNRVDHTRVDEDLDDDEKHHNWFVNIFADAREGGGGGGGWDADDWAAVIYVVIGVVVVGAFVIYGVQMLGEMAFNQEEYPLFMEAGVRLSYSGKAIEDQQGVGQLYRDAYLAGLRFAIGFDRPGMGIGLAAEGGYIDIFLRSTSDPARTFDFKGGYLVAGPMIRFGDNDPWSFTLEFLNGTSTHDAIGWISKSRMTLQAKVTEHMLVGGHLGAVFYDLHFFDGLGLREGNFNRDLSLVWGLDTGWEF